MIGGQLAAMKAQFEKSREPVEVNLPSGKKFTLLPKHKHAFKQTRCIPSIEFPGVQQYQITSTDALSVYNTLCELTDKATESKASSYLTLG